MVLSLTARLPASVADFSVCHCPESTLPWANMDIFFCPSYKNENRSAFSPFSVSASSALQK